MITVLSLCYYDVVVASCLLCSRHVITALLSSSDHCVVAVCHQGVVVVVASRPVCAGSVQHAAEALEGVGGDGRGREGDR